MPIIKYDSAICSRILELYALGKSITEIAKLLRVQRMTIYRWIKKHELQPIMDKLLKDNEIQAINTGLQALAKGAESTDIKREYIDNSNPDKLVKITETIRKDKPDVKAMQILARKHDLIVSDLEDNESDSKRMVLLGIANTSTMSQRELQEHSAVSPLGSIVDVEYSEVDSDSEDLGPPQEDSE